MFFKCTCYLTELHSISIKKDFSQVFADRPGDTKNCPWPRSWSSWPLVTSLAQICCSEVDWLSISPTYTFWVSDALKARSPLGQAGTLCEARMHVNTHRHIHTLSKRHCSFWETASTCTILKSWDTSKPFTLYALLRGFSQSLSLPAELYQGVQDASTTGNSPASLSPRNVVCHLWQFYKEKY